MKSGDENKPGTINGIEMLKHDIKNQLSNIQLALEGLRYEVDDTGGDMALYMDSITQAAAKIDKLLDGFE
jgi:nitrogen-specific signal transduction histidine kinase